MIATRFAYANEAIFNAVPRQRVRPSIRLRESDTYQGVVTDPISLHKYLYANANPVSHVDPTGKFTTTELAVTGAIIGGIIGFSAGTYIGYQKTGRLLSWKTLEYGLIGAAVGATAGLMIGGTIGVLLNAAAPAAVSLPWNSLFSILQVSSKLVQQLAALKVVQVSAATFLGGVLAGVVAEVTFPDRWQDWITPASLLALPADATAIIIWNTFVTKVPGFAAESVIAIAGFNVGYFGAKNLGSLPTTIPQMPNMMKEILTGE